jgi:DNA-3-methyladenine glycosylase I
MSVKVGEDGRGRCPWGLAAPEFVAYHDDEWGWPLHGDRELFERLTLEAFQSGLSWLVIFRKREGFRRAFLDFDAGRVAAFTGEDVQLLMNDQGIVRNRAKIEATIRNARAMLELDTPLDELLWSFAPPPGRPRPATAADVPAITPESTAMSKALKKRGFAFVGPTTCYAMMQAVGMVDDHIVGCWRAEPG